MVWQRFNGRDGRFSESERQRMIAEHSAFLSWAMRHRGRLPAIPRRRLAHGGFGALLKRPGARAAVEHWWRRVLEQFGA